MQLPRAVVCLPTYNERENLEPMLRALGEFLLPYDAVRTAISPDDVLLAFLHSTYEAAAELRAYSDAELSDLAKRHPWDYGEV